MVTLTQDKNGNYRARKRLPDDVREDYSRRYGQAHEVKFFRPANTKKTVATQDFHEWIAETEGRIAGIRSLHDGSGISLTPRQARAFAGEWYKWFTSRHPKTDRRHWEDLRDKVHEAHVDAVGLEEWERLETHEVWDDPSVRHRVRPVLADVGETAQFLALKGLVLNNEAYALFVDNLYEDLAVALGRLVRLSEGDYSPDEYPKRFPQGDPFSHMVRLGRGRCSQTWRTTFLRVAC